MDGNLDLRYINKIRSRVAQNNSSQTKAIPAPENGTTVLFICCLSVVIISFMFSALNVALPIINQDFKADAILLNWIITAFVLVSAIFSVPFGRIADIVGIKKIFLMRDICLHACLCLGNFR